MSMKPASRQALILLLAVISLLLARQATCAQPAWDATEAWSLRTLHADVGPQQRDPDAVCQTNVRANLSNTCHINCRVCTVEAGVGPAARTCQCCDAGYYGPINKPGAICERCPAGQWSNAGSTHCRVCPRGTTTAGTDRTGCKACKRGRYSSTTTNAQGKTVLACPKCPNNSISAGGPVPVTCTPCDPHASSSNGLVCNLCDPGYGGPQCSQCPANTFWQGGGAVNAKCRPCPPGQYSDPGAANCTQGFLFPPASSCANDGTGSAFVCATGFNETTGGSIGGDTPSQGFTTCCTEDNTLTFPAGATCGDVRGDGTNQAYNCGTSYTPKSGASSSSIEGGSPSSALSTCCTLKR